MREQRQVPETESSGLVSEVGEHGGDVASAVGGSSVKICLGRSQL